MAKAKKKSNFLVFYSKNCTPHIANFNSYSAAEKFVSKFYQDHSDNQSDNWVDCIIKGNIERCYEGWSGYVVVEKQK